MKYNKEMRFYIAYRDVFGSGDIDVYATYGDIARYCGAISSNQKRRVRKEWKDAWKNYCVDWHGGI